MRKSLAALCLTCVLTPALSAYASGKGDDLNRPIPPAARRLAVRGTELVAHDQVEEGLALLKRAIALASNYIWAHARYIAARTFNQGRYDEVRAEYDRLMAKEPDNPIYPMVLAEAERVPPENKRIWYEKVVALAPGWSWAHRARATLYLIDGKAELAPAELLKCIDQDGTAEGAYHTLIFVQEDRLGRIDDAILTAEKLASQPEFRLQGLRQLWRLRLSKAQGSDEAKAGLRDELARRASAARDVETLSAIRSAYLDLLKDSDGADRVEGMIRRKDPTWYPERGQTLFIAATTESGIPRALQIANRQFSIFRQVEQVNGLEPKEKMERLGKLLSLNPGPEMRIFIYQRLLRAAEEAKDLSTFIRYGEALRILDPGDTGLLAKIAIALADQKTDLGKALSYARLAEEATNGLRLAKRLRNTPPEWFTRSFPETRQGDKFVKV